MEFFARAETKRTVSGNFQLQSTFRTASINNPVNLVDIDSIIT